MCSVLSILGLSKAYYIIIIAAATSEERPTVMSFDGRIDLDALQSPTAIEKFDYDSMNISELEIEAGLDTSIVTECWDRTPMHVAVVEKKDTVVRCFIEYKGNVLLFQLISIIFKFIR